MFSLIITRLFPPSWSPACAAPSWQTPADCSLVQPSGRFVSERQHSSSRIASVGAAAAGVQAATQHSSHSSSVCRCCRRRRTTPRRRRCRRCRSLVCSRALAWATTTIPTVANSPLPWRLPRRHEDIPDFNRLRPLAMWPLRMNPRSRQVLVMIIGLMMCSRL